MRSLIDILDFSVEDLNELLATANDIIANPSEYAEKCKGKKLATLFFEPSTRTRLSFETAINRLVVAITIATAHQCHDADNHDDNSYGGEAYHTPATHNRKCIFIL